jgi:ElaB/YqjD/DUF883 family membrane-anchored ribosome-binding protein
MESQDLRNAAARAEDKVRETLEDAEDKVVSTAEGYRERAADALHRGAQSARRYSGRASSDRATRLSRRTGEELEHAADYMEHHSIRQIMGDCGAWMRQNPGTSLAAALVCGVIVSRALRR